MPASRSGEARLPFQRNPGAFGQRIVNEEDVLAGAVADLFQAERLQTDLPDPSRAQAPWLFSRASKPRH